MRMEGVGGGGLGQIDQIGSNVHSKLLGLEEGSDSLEMK